MSKSEADFAGALRKLSRWFERGQRVLPWRSEPSLYRVWIAEIMLQQTQVATVVPYFERFLRQFPDVNVLARAREEDVLAAWAGLGYYSRSRNLLRAAREIAARGELPRTREGWLGLPGVGPYTAGAIVSIALDLPEPILDGNVERVLSRLRRVGRTQGDAPYKKDLWLLARSTVETGNALGLKPSAVNQALMELGAMVCTPLAPSCDACPLSAACQARVKGDAQAFPPPRLAKGWIRVREQVHCLVDDRGWILVGQRPEGQWRAGLWDFPFERPRLSAVDLGQVSTRHVVTRHKIERETRVSRTRGRVAARRDGLRWVDPADPGVAVGSAWRKAMAAVFEAYPSVFGWGGPPLRAGRVAANRLNGPDGD